jgi:hypothetical protein
MAFDSKRVHAALEEDLGLTFELGQTYVAPGEAPPRFTVLDERRARTLAAWADALVPGDEHWPSASAAAAAQYADASAGRSPLQRRALRAAVDAVDAALLAAGETRALDELDLGARVEILQAVEREHGQLFTLVLELVYEGYYRDPDVQAVVEARTGFQVDVPVHGMRLEPFDESQLDAMRARSAAWREVPER